MEQHQNYVSQNGWGEAPGLHNILPRIAIREVKWQNIGVVQKQYDVQDTLERGRSVF